MQNRNDVNVHTLHPTDNGICHAKLIEVHPPNIFSHLLLTKIFSSLVSARTYHGQGVATLVLRGVNRLELQMGLRGCYATLFKTVYY